MMTPALFGGLTGSPRYAGGKEKAIAENEAGTGTAGHFWKNRQEKDFYGRLCQSMWLFVFGSVIVHGRFVLVIY